MKVFSLFLFSIFALFPLQAEYYGQCAQDKLLFEHYFWGKKEGVFVDIGAHNGVTYSNSYFFEKLGWKGLCVEPIPECYQQLVKNRKCVTVQGCVTDFTGKGEFVRIKSPVVGLEMLSGLLRKSGEVCRRAF